MLIIYQWYSNTSYHDYLLNPNSIDYLFELPNESVEINSQLKAFYNEHDSLRVV